MKPMVLKKFIEIKTKTKPNVNDNDNDNVNDNENGNENGNENAHTRGSRFDEFWKIYPRKNNMLNAQTEYTYLLGNDTFSF